MANNQPGFFNKLGAAVYNNSRRTLEHIQETFHIGLPTVPQPQAVPSEASSEDGISRDSDFEQDLDYQGKFFNYVTSSNDR